MAKQYEDMDAITAASPALRAIGSHLGQLGGDTTFDVLAVDTSRFYDVAWFRDDFSDEPLPELMQDIAGYDLSLPIQLPDDLPDIPLTDNIPLPDAAPGIQDLIPQDEPLPGLMEGIAGGVIPLGIPLPDNARAIQALVKADRAHPSVILGVRLRDSNGRYFSFPMGFLESSNWRLYGAELFEGGNPRFRLFPARPFTLVSIGVLGDGPRARAGSRFAADRHHPRPAVHRRDRGAGRLPGRSGGMEYAGRFGDGGTGQDAGVRGVGAGRRFANVRVGGRAFAGSSRRFARSRTGSYTLASQARCSCGSSDTR